MQYSDSVSKNADQSKVVQAEHEMHPHPQPTPVHHEEQQAEQAAVMSTWHAVRRDTLAVTKEAVVDHVAVRCVLRRCDNYDVYV